MAKMDTEAVLTQTRKRLEQEPAVADPTRITVDIEKRGSLFNRRYAIVLSGAVGSEAEGRRIAEGVKDSVANYGQIDVENHLVVPLV